MMNTGDPYQQSFGSVERHMNACVDKIEKTDAVDLTAEVDIVNGSPVMAGLLHSISGLLAILDEHRRVVALNDSFLKMLGIDEPSEVLGLRLGEALKCIHEGEDPAGCGTTKYCSTCGAAIAMVSSLNHDKPVERICALTAKREGATIDMAFLVRSSPIGINAKRFLLLFLQDITLQQQRAALERTFFHDLKNMLAGLIGAADLLAPDCYDPVLVHMIRLSSSRICKEIELQRCLFQGEQFSYETERLEVTPELVIKELQSFFINHPAARDKKIHFSLSGSGIPFKTDLSLLLRVLCNMVTNALEATDNNGKVKVWSEQGQEVVSFFAWNDKMIEPDTALRIFQRNFSTKNEAGRGIGTYAMKLFGEKILGGKVNFTTSAKAGTIFKISLPC